MVVKVVVIIYKSYIKTAITTVTLSGTTKYKDCCCFLHNIVLGQFLEFKLYCYVFIVKIKVNIANMSNYIELFSLLIKVNILTFENSFTIVFS